MTPFSETNELNRVWRFDLILHVSVLLPDLSPWWARNTTIMFEGIVADLLNKYLGKYVQNLDTENLSIGILDGEYSLIYCFNTLRQRQNGRHFTDDTFKLNFLNENFKNSMKISLKFVPKGPINNIPALVQIMAWRRSGDKPLSEPVVGSLLTHICVTRPQWVKPSLKPRMINCSQQIITNIKLHMTGCLQGEPTADWWIPLTKGQ